MTTAEIIIKNDFDVVLTLSRDEAVTLRAVCDFIGGSMDTRRRHTDAIAMALNSINIDTDNPDVRAAIQDMHDTPVPVHDLGPALYFGETI